MLTEQLISTEIDPAHRDEWLESAIDPEIIKLNLRSLWGNIPYEYLFYSPNISRRNDGRLRDGALRKYRHIEHGGWWCSGVDPLNNYEQMLWGCWKSNKPRRDLQKIHKIIKYEHPYKEATRAFFLYVPYKIWAKISARCGIPITEEDRLDSRGFWYWVWRHNVPLIICEGVKKAAALLTAGYVAIAIPGVNGGYRNPKNPLGEPTGELYLIPEIQHFATLGREITICFDHDTKPATVQRVNTAISQTSKLLRHCGCQIKITDWNYPEKGIDDLIAARGQSVAEEVTSKALTLEQWLVKGYNRLSYTANLVLNQRYLGNLPIPDIAKLICLKAPKGSGKTESLAPIVKEAIANGQPVILLSHRVQLAQAISDRVGIPYVTEVKNCETGALLGFALCVDSLRPHSQARFNAANWKEPLVIIDESEQVIWHALTASTEVKKHRVEVLKQLSQLLKNALSPGLGKVIIADADLSDLSVELVTGIAEVNIQPWVVVNNWKGQPWKIHHYNQTTPVNWLAALKAYIKNGGKPFIAVDGQKAKSKWGTKVLEAWLKKHFPHLKTLRIDSETIADPQHPAYGCIDNLNTILLTYDIVIASPSIGTGVSIDIQGHFTSVWGCYQGVAPENSTRQSLARVREAVPRHIWVAKHGLGKIGNGAINLKSLLACEHKRFQANLRLLQDAALTICDDIDINRTALNVWGKMACRINAGMIAYRDTVLEGLRDEGHIIVEGTDTETPVELKDEINPAKLKDKINPTKLNDEINPTKLNDEINSTNLKNETSSTKLNDEINPADLKDEINVEGTDTKTPVELKNEINPTELKDEIDPAKLKDEINVEGTDNETPVLSKSKINSAKLKDKINVKGTDNETPVRSKDKNNPAKLKDEINAVKEEVYNTECQAIAAADTSEMTPTKYEALQQQRAKTADERHLVRKYKLEQMYGVEVTPKLVALDDDGYYSRLKLHYYLTVGRKFVGERDRKLGEKMLLAQSAWLPDFNGGQMSLVISALEKLGILNFINSDRELRGNDEDLVRMANYALSVQWQVKAVLGVGLNESHSPIVILRKLLRTIGLKLEYLGRDGSGERQRFYRVVGGDDDGRGEIFKHWLTKDLAQSTQPDPRPLTVSIDIENAVDNEIQTSEN